LKIVDTRTGRGTQVSREKRQFLKRKTSIVGKGQTQEGKAWSRWAEKSHGVKMKRPVW